VPLHPGCNAHISGNLATYLSYFLLSMHTSIGGGKIECLSSLQNLNFSDAHLELKPWVGLDQLELSASPPPPSAASGDNDDASTTTVVVVALVVAAAVLLSAAVAGFLIRRKRMFAAAAAAAAAAGGFDDFEIVQTVVSIIREAGLPLLEEDDVVAERSIGHGGGYLYTLNVVDPFVALQKGGLVWSFNHFL
jgi:hypothetical protein